MTRHEDELHLSLARNGCWGAEDEQVIEQERVRPRENWYDAEYVKSWLDQQDGRADERLKSFAMIRALIPRRVYEPLMPWILAAAMAG